MRVTNEQAKAIAETIYGEGQDMTKKNLAADLLEARELIKEMREDLLKLSQYSIASVCEEARIIAREAWKKSMEVKE